MKRTDFSLAMTNYLLEYLPKTCGLSNNTINSYRDVFKLLLVYYRDVCNIKAETLELSMFTSESISSFLDWLEESRASTISTRNQRLAVIKGFTRYLQYRFPEYTQNYMDIMDLRKKKGPRPVIPFLTEDQLKLLFSKPDASTKKGLRDLALLVLLYDSGARVQEIADAKVKDIRLDKPAMITLTGKGSKTRQVPLMKNTCQLMKSYLKSIHHSPENIMAPLFYNCHNEHLTRYGITYILKKYVSMIDELKGMRISPHVLRHTKAMHMLQAGVNLVYIRDFLGHSQITTTEVYARADPETKRKLFEESVPNYTAGEVMPWNEDADLLEWLTSFGKSYDKQ